MIRLQTAALAVLALVSAPATASGGPGTAPGLAESRTQPHIDPQMQGVIDAFEALGGKPVHTQTPELARRSPAPANAVMKLLEDAGRPIVATPIHRVQDRRLRGPTGPIPVRIYTPARTSRPAPAIVYFHGGGFVVGDLDTYDESARALAAGSRAIVVSVHYPQAPELPYPAAHEHAVAAFDSVVDHARQLGIDPDRVAVAGESAGANLATHVAIHQKAVRGRQPVVQVLIYPFISNDLNTPSHREFGRGDYLVSNADLTWFWHRTLGDGWRSNRDPRALPIYATRDDLRGVAPAVVVLAELDPLLHDGLAYADHLKDAGVATEVLRYAGVTHEFFGMGAVVPAAARAQADVSHALERALHRSPQASRR
jgi:acetyl esterase